MPSSPAELIKEKTDIVEFLRGYLTLQPAGKNFKALCPFHKEKTASFMVSPDRQSWHCFGCAAGGDVFSFLMQFEHIEFPEALRILAEKAGVELRQLNPAEYKFTGLLFELQHLATEFFQRELEKSEVARAYVKSRGLSRETVAQFELGWAPPGPEALTLHLMRTGVAPDDAVRAGLALKTDRGLLIDRFRGRVMFPLHNHFGKVAGFTGRILPQFDTGETGKYVNSPETPVFNKSRLLYGFWATKNAMRERRSAFLVEGQMDFLMSWQAGVRHAVATSGTAFTPDHLRILKRVADELVFSFDNDEAGLAAGERAIDMAQANDFGVKVAMLAGYKDPAEAAQDAPEKLLKVVAEARPAMEFYFSRYLPEGRLDFSERANLLRVRAVLAKVKLVASAVTQSVWRKELAKRTGLDERVLAEEEEKLAEASVAPRAAGEEDERASVAEERPLTRLEFISERLLSSAAAQGFSGIGECEAYLPPRYRRLAELLRSGKTRSEDPALDQALDAVFLRSESFPAEELGALKAELAKEYFKERRGTLAHAVKLAEAKGDDAGVRAALDELRSIPHSI